MKLEVIAWDGDALPRQAELGRRLEDEGFEAMAWSDAAGATYPPHRHERDESLWLVRGELVVEVAGRRHALGPGDRLMLPAGTEHAAVAGRAGASYWIGRR